MWLKCICFKAGSFTIALTVKQISSSNIYSPLQNIRTSVPFHISTYYNYKLKIILVELYLLSYVKVVIYCEV